MKLIQKTLAIAAVLSVVSTGALATSPVVELLIPDNNCGQMAVLLTNISNAPVYYGTQKYPTPAYSYPINNGDLNQGISITDASGGGNTLCTAKRVPCTESYNQGHQCVDLSGSGCSSNPNISQLVIETDPQMCSTVIGIASNSSTKALKK